MNKLKENILNSLKKIKGSGRFVSAGSIDFVFPGLQVENMGEISYPINKLQGEALIRIAHKGPFGKGNKTIHDNQVRSTWEIDASKLRAEVDLKTETIKTGSPHILRIIKTQAAYNKEMKVLEEDLALLNKIMLKEDK